MTSQDKKWLTLTLVFSIVALALSVYAGFSSHKLKASLVEASFNTKVEKGIEAYIQKQQADRQPPPAPTEPVEVSVDDDAMKGDEDAPITIVEFSDYECPFCGRHTTQTVPQIMEKYVKTGKAKYVFRDFPLGFHQNAKPAAIAAECVREEGGDDAYWNYHDVLFDNQQALGMDNLKNYASDLGYDITNCLDSAKYADEVDADTADGSKVGVRGTPATFINGRLVSGAQPFAAFESVIEEELNK